MLTNSCCVPHTQYVPAATFGKRPSPSAVATVCSAIAFIARACSGGEYRAHLFHGLAILSDEGRRAEVFQRRGEKVVIRRVAFELEQARAVVGQGLLDRLPDTVIRGAILAAEP